jgi:carboxypeptidase C (cathepsin A)
MQPTMRLFILLFFAIFFFTANAQKNSINQNAADTVLIADSTTAPIITKHSVTINGQTINYTATTGYLPLKDAQGKTKANIFFIAYTKDGVNKDTRPITYAFNGGPGSASIWLHMGVLGPYRVVVNDDGTAPNAPFRYEANPYSWLDMTDLLFIDPVSTGYSRPAGSENAQQFHGYTEDIQSVGDFIRYYTTKFERWSSPKFIAGESYGTTRAAGLSGYLQERYNIFLNGIILVSSVLNFQTLEFSTGNELPYVMFLPTYTATAWYHKKLPPEMQQKSLREVVQAARDYASNEYLLTLMKGDMLTDEEENTEIKKLHSFTGLSEEFIRRCNLHVSDGRFFKELLRDSSKTIGRYDSRFTGVDRDDAGEGIEYDPSGSNVMGIFTGAMNTYVRKELQYKNDLPYEVLTYVGPWTLSTNNYLDVSETLRSAMSQNPYLKVWVTCGYYDLATPFFNAEYTVHHMGLRPEQRDRVSITYYEAGHMMYINKPSLIQLKKDAESFYEKALH